MIKESKGSFYGIKNMLNFKFIGLIVLFQILLYFIFKKKILRNIIRLKLIDKPGKNKIHKSNTPLTGGIILFFSLIFYFISAFLFTKNYSNYDIFNDSVLIFFIGGSFAFFIGIIDDILHLKVEKKILALSIFNILLFQQIGFFQTNIIIFDNSFFHLKINTASLGLIISILFFLSYHYALVILDGINGIFGLYSISIFTIFFFFFDMNIYLSNFILYFLLILIFITILNLKNELFFGNSGSLLVSTLIPYFILYFYNQRQNDYYSFIFLTLFIIPVLDMIRLFFNRLIARKSPFSKDLNHFHHLLLKRYSLNFSIFIYLSLCFFPFFMIKFFFINPIILVIIQIITFFYFADKFKPKKS